MTTLIFGFFGLVLVPAAVLSLFLGRIFKTVSPSGLDDDQIKFTISQDSK